eukprot:95230-Prorocentrum_minimum.AAC.1
MGVYGRHMSASSPDMRTLFDPQGGIAEEARTPGTPGNPSRLGNPGGQVAGRPEARGKGEAAAN